MKRIELKTENIDSVIKDLRLQKQCYNESRNLIVDWITFFAIEFPSVYQEALILNSGKSIIDKRTKGNKYMKKFYLDFIGN